MYRTTAWTFFDFEALYVINAFLKICICISLAKEEMDCFWHEIANLEFEKYCKSNFNPIFFYYYLIAVINENHSFRGVATEFFFHYILNFWDAFSKIEFFKKRKVYSESALKTVQANPTHRFQERITWKKVAL